MDAKALEIREANRGIEGNSDVEEEEEENE